MIQRGVWLSKSGRKECRLHTPLGLSGNRVLERSRAAVHAVGAEAMCALAEPLARAGAGTGTVDSARSGLSTTAGADTTGRLPENERGNISSSFYPTEVKHNGSTRARRTTEVRGCSSICQRRLRPAAALWRVRSHGTRPKRPRRRSAVSVTKSGTAKVRVNLYGRWSCARRRSFLCHETRLARQPRLSWLRERSRR